MGEAATVAFDGVFRQVCQKFLKGDLVISTVELDIALIPEALEVISARTVERKERFVRVEGGTTCGAGGRSCGVC